MKQFDTLYKRTATGAVQIWYQETDGDKWRSISGQIDGQKVTSGWHQCYPTNEGRANARTAEEQAVFEVEANYTKRLRLGYWRDQKDIDNPIHFKPMLAKTFDNKTPYEDVFAQPKLDGIRCIATATGLFSRSGKPLLATPHIHEALLEQGLFDTFPVLDGELYSHDFKEDFNTIISNVRKTKPTPEDLEAAKSIQYHIYDCLLENEEIHFSDRILTLLNTIKETDYIKLVDTRYISSREDLDDHYDSVSELGYEGQMIRIDGPYENKRSKYLWKRKEFQDSEYKIVRIEEGLGNRAGMAGKVVCQMDDGRTFGAGIKGSHEYSKQLLKDADKYVGGTATVKYFRLTPDGIPRFPVAIAIYEGERDL